MKNEKNNSTTNSKNDILSGNTDKLGTNINKEKTISDNIDLSLGDNQLEFFVQEKEDYFRRLPIEELKKSALAPSFDMEYLKKKKTTYNKLTQIES